MWWAIVKVSAILSGSYFSIPEKDQFDRKADCITEVNKRNERAKSPMYVCIPMSPH